MNARLCCSVNTSSAADDASLRLRRSFLKWSGAASAAAAVGGKAPVLYALTPDETKKSSAKPDTRYSVCGMCLNACGLVAKVENGVITKLAMLYLTSEP